MTNRGSLEGDEGTEVRGGEQEQKRGAEGTWSTLLKPETAPGKWLARHMDDKNDHLFLCAIGSVFLWLGCDRKRAGWQPVMASCFPFSPGQIKGSDGSLLGTRAGRRHANPLLHDCNRDQRQVLRLLYRGMYNDVSKIGTGSCLESGYHDDARATEREVLFWEN